MRQGHFCDCDHDTVLCIPKWGPASLLSLELTVEDPRGPGRGSGIGDTITVSGVLQSPCNLTGF